MPFTLPQLPSGKVRELYDAGDGRLLMVASDRVSAFDVVMHEAIPEKGRVLTAMTVFWCEEMADVAPGSLLAASPEDIAAALPGQSIPAEWAGRSPLVRRAEMLPIECIVRGYLAGQAWEEYERSGTVHGTVMPTGLRMADRLAEPIFTPSTKAAEGHDLNISFAEAANLVGAEVAAAARDISLELYRRAAARAAGTSGSSWPTPTWNWGTWTGCSYCATRCARRTPPACGRPTRSSPGSRPRPSTSSRCGTGWSTSPGTGCRPRPRCRTG